MDESKWEVIYRNVGYATMQWALVESTIHTMMLRELVAQGDFGDWMAMWKKLKSFDLRIEIIRAILDQQHLEDSLKRDLKLILECAASFSKRRNAIVHSTGVLRGPQLEPAVLPFYVGNADAAVMTMDEVARWGSDFKRLADAIQWVTYDEIRQPKPPAPARSIRPGPVPGLVLELRSRDEQKRNDQRRVQRDVTLLKRLRASGKWPLLDLEDEDL